MAMMLVGENKISWNHCVNQSSIVWMIIQSRYAGLMSFNPSNETEKKLIKHLSKTINFKLWFKHRFMCTRVYSKMVTTILVYFISIHKSIFCALWADLLFNIFRFNWICSWLDFTQFKNSSFELKQTSVFVFWDAISERLSL